MKGVVVVVIVLLSLLSIAEIANAIAYKDCGSQTGSIVSIAITNCTDKPPCVFVRGNDYSIQVTFKSNVSTRRVVNSVYGVIKQIPVPFHLPNNDGCSLGISCPVSAGSTLTESVTMPVKNDYPSISLYVKWEVTDDQNKMLACFLFPVKLQ